MADNSLGSTDYIEAQALIGYADKVKIQLHEKRILDARARFALVLLEKWALIAAAPDGDDTAGRQKLRRLDPDEIARYACDISGCAFDQFEKRGWIADIGDLANAAEKAVESN